MRKRLIALLMCMLLIMGTMACSGGETSQNDSSKAETSQAADSSKAETSQADSSATESGEVTYPLSDETVELSYYIKINGAMSATMETYADVEFFKYLEELTNVKIQWDHNTSDEAFSMMIASGVYPDMINWNLANAAGGVPALLEDEVILDLT